MNEHTIPTLDHTVEMMRSIDYKERFKAEYYQLELRLDKLKAMLDKWDNPTIELGFTPTCPRTLYNLQVKAMEDYLAVLQARAAIEGVSL